MNNQGKNILIWVSVFVLMILTFHAFQNDSLMGSKSHIAFSDFLTKIDEKAVSSVKIQGRTISGTLSDGATFSTYAPDYADLINKLSSNGVHIEVSPPDTKMNSLFSIFVSWFPMILLICVWVFFMRQMQGGGKAMGFGKSKAKLISDKGPKVTFKDVRQGLMKLRKN